MSRPILVTDWRATGGNGVYTYTNGTVSQIGSDFGAELTGSSNQYRAYNRAIHWAGDLWALGDARLWKYDVANSGDWGVYHDFQSSARSDAASRACGFWPVTINDVSYITWGYINTSNQLVFARMDKDGVITEGAGNTTGASEIYNAQLSWDTPILHQGKPAWGILETSARPKLFVYDPGADTVSSFINNTAQYFNVSLDPCSVGTTLYTIAEDAALECHLWTAEAGTFVKRANISMGVTHSLAGSWRRPCLIYDDTYLWALFYGDGTQDGWELRRIEIAATGYIVENHSYAIPAALRRNGGTGAGVESSWHKYVDVESTPGTPQINLWYFPDKDTGNSVELYSFDPAGPTFMSLGAGADTFEYAISHGALFGGERAWAGSGELGGMRTGHTVNAVDIDVDYEIFGGSGQEVNVEWYFTDDNNNIKTQCTILSSEEGTVVGGTIISGVTADSVAKKFKWGAVLDGISSVATLTLAPRVYQV